MYFCMHKKVVKKIALFLVILFAYSSTGFTVEISDSMMQQYKTLLRSQGTNALSAVKKTTASSQNNNNLLNEGILDTSESELDIKTTSIKQSFPSDKSDLEEYFAKTISEEAETYKFKPLAQFGYDIFQQKGVALGTSYDDQQIVSQDYILAPGDSFTVTMWGIAEGVFNVDVNAEGNIILPKVGVVPVSGVRYGELEKYIEGQLSRFYEQVNVAVTIKNVTGVRVYVVGEVKRPGTYNTSSLSTAYNALFLAGGPTKRGSLRDVRVIRNGKTIARIDLYSFLLWGKRERDIHLASGDTVFVPVIGPVTAVAGNVRRSGIFELKSNARADLSDVLEMAGGVMPTTYVNRVQIQRIIAHEKQTVIDKQFNFAEANPRFYIDIKDMDLIKFYPINSPADNVVYLEGAVKYPGPCQWKPGMGVKDLIASSSDLQIGAYLPRAEIVRTDSKTLAIKIIDLELGKLLAGDNRQNITLEPRDHLVIASELKTVQKVELKGEFRLPGIYTITKGERLSSVIKRAGEYPETAYLYGAVLKRKSAKDAQSASYKDLINKMETELILKERETSGPGLTADDIAIKQQENERNRELITKLKDTTVIEGRVIIALRDPDDMVGTKDDIALEDGDELYIPKIPNVVNVLGEVYSPSSVVFMTGKPTSYYLNMVGGATDQANTGDIYLLRADGSIVSRRQGRNVMTTALLPGDTVLVPKSFDRFDFWMALKDGTHWFYEATLAFAVIATYVRK